MSEFFRQEATLVDTTPEMLQPPETQLHDAIHYAALNDGSGKPAEEQLASQRQQLWSSVHQGIAIHPRAAPEIKAYGEMADYLLFGDTHAPLPSALGHNADGHIVPEKTEINGLTHASIHAVMEDLGLANLIQQRKQNLADKKDTFIEPLKQFIHNTEGYALIHSLSHEQTPAEQPLSPLERAHEEARRMAKVQQDTNRSYPIDYTSPDTIAAQLTAQDFARRRLTRAALYDLNEMTQRAPKADATGNTQAQAFFAELAATYMEKFSDDNITSIKSTDEFHGEIDRPTCILNDEIHVPWDVLVDDYNHEAYAESALSAITPQQRMSESLLAEVAHTLFDESHPSHDAPLRDMLQAAVETVARQEASMLPYTQEAIVSSAHSQVSFDEQIIKLANLTKLPLERKPLAPLPNYAKSRNPLYFDSTTLSHEYMEEQQRRTVAEVRRAPANDTATRLLIEDTALIHESISAQSDEADLVLVIHEGHGKHYRIPGYELVSYDPDTNEYGFRYTPASDPYAPCTTPLTREQLQGGASTALHSGALPLAAAIQHAPGLTVDGYARLITDHSYYLEPDEGDPRANVSHFQPRDGHDLRYFYESEQEAYAVQCDMATVVGQVYARMAHLGATGNIIGYALTPRAGSRVGGMVHEQMTLIDATTKAFHIIDLTPGRTPNAPQEGTAGIIGGLLGRMGILEKPAIASTPKRMLKGLGKLFKSMGETAAVEQPAPVAAAVAKEIPQQRTTEKRALTEKEIHERLASNRTKLYKQLGRATRTRNQTELIRDIASRSQHDLMRIVAEIVEETIPFQSVAAVPRKLSHGRATNMLGYIHELRTQPSSVRDPFNYAMKPQLLATLEKSLQTVVSLTQNG